MTNTGTSVAGRLSALRDELDGRLVLPGETDWDDSRRAWQLLVDQHPAAIVNAASVADVVATVRAARELGLRVAPQATGHAAGALTGLDSAILLRTRGLDEVRIDPQARTARIGAGVQWADVAALIAEHGLAAVTGMASDVGVIGNTLGGGLGWLGRSHGLGANGVTAVEIVDADGVQRRVDADHHADLFWALRGGTAPVIVTAIEFRLHSVPDLHAGALLWPIERAGEILHAWRGWIADLPDSVTSVARVMRYPAMPEMPPFLQGRAFVVVEAAVQEPDAVAEGLLAPLRALGPEFDTIQRMRSDGLGAVHGDPDQPIPGYGAAVMLAAITDKSIDAFLRAAVSDAAAPLLSIELRHLGGALAPGRASGGAVDALAGEGMVFIAGFAPVPEALAQVTTAADRVLGELAPFAAERAFRNFSERPVEPVRLYGDATARLAGIAEEWDADRIILLAHQVR